MTRALSFQTGLGLVFAAAGLVVLLRPGVLRAAEHDARSYALRILGMMLFAAGLMLAAFAIAFRMAAP